MTTDDLDIKIALVLGSIGMILGAIAFIIIILHIIGLR